MSRQAMQQALEALIMMRDKYDEYACPACDHADAAITALRAALAEPEQNPFDGDAERYAHKVHEEREAYKALFIKHKPEQEPNGISWLKRDSGYFTAPTPRKPLTDEQIDAVYIGCKHGSINEFARAIERAHGIGEQHA